MRRPTNDHNADGKEAPGITWRVGQDGVAHAIEGCDPNASAWVALCGKIITGPVQSDPACEKCKRLDEPEPLSPVRVQLSRKRGWKMPPNTVKVDRSTRWGNPFYIAPTDAQAPYYACHNSKEAVELFREHLQAIRKKGYLLTNPKRGWEISVVEIQRELRGKNLACWCKPGDDCHADVLLDLANNP